MGTYCDSEDVRAYVQRVDAYTTSSVPSTADLERIIQGVEDEIDAKTDHAWRERRVVESYYTVRWERTFRLGLPAAYVDLDHIQVRPLTNPQDKLEVFNGSAYVDWLDPTEGKVHGRTDDYFLLERPGTLYILRGISHLRSFPDGIRVTFRYGELEVPGDVHQLAVQMAAIEILSTAHDEIAMEGGLGPSVAQPVSQTITRLQAKVDQAFRDIRMRTPDPLPYISGGPRWG